MTTLDFMTGTWEHNHMWSFLNHSTRRDMFWKHDNLSSISFSVSCVSETLILTNVQLRGTQSRDFSEEDQCSSRRFMEWLLCDRTGTKKLNVLCTPSLTTSRIRVQNKDVKGTRFLRSFHLFHQVQLNYILFRKRLNQVLWHTQMHRHCQEDANRRFLSTTKMKSQVVATWGISPFKRLGRKIESITHKNNRES
jgi:hypothetical protein